MSQTDNLQGEHSSTLAPSLEASTNLPAATRSLQRQMTLTLSVIIIGMVLLIGLPIGFISIRLQQQEAVHEQQTLADQAAQNLSSVLQILETNEMQISPAKTRNRDARFAANEIITILDLTIMRVSAQAQTLMNRSESLDVIFERNPQIYGIQIFDMTGRQQASAWRNTPLASVTRRPSRESMEVTRQGISTRDDFFFTEAHLPIMVIATPVTGTDQNQQIVLTWVGVPSIWTYLVDVKIGKGGYLYLIDEGNRLIQAPSRFAIDQIVELPVATERSFDRSAYKGLSGDRVIGHVVPIENTSWRLVAEIPVAEANAGIRSLLIILLAILLFGISLAISVPRMFSRWLLQPIHTLHESAARISNGDLTHRISLNRDDELGFLASTFNHMVSTLERTINELRSVSLNLLTAQETERRRIAQEIHDELGQTLTALRLNLWMSMKGHPEDQSLANAHQQATEIQEKARSLSHELRPSMLDELGLMPTLEWYIDRIEQRANLAIVLDVDLDEACLPAETKTVIYRLVVEGLTNISKHAHASVAEIKITRQKQALVLSITDDGVGFDAIGTEQTASLGIAGMRERVNLLGGAFLIDSKIGEGTYININLPLALKETYVNPRILS